MTTDADVPASPPVTPLQRVWRRYLKVRGGKIGLALVVVFALVAFFAPFLAHRLPFFWYDNVSGELGFPLVREFFAPSDTTEPLLERGINFLLLFIPAAFLTWRCVTGRWPRLARSESRAVAWLFGALFSAALWLSIGGMVVQGGGGDWLHHENPPVPEIDDVKELAAIARAGHGTDELEQAIRRRLDELGANLADASYEPGRPETEAFRRRLTWALQEAIDGPALASSADLAGRPGFDPLDITGANLAVGINTPRWNRLLVEACYPGLLAPMREFRGTFLTVAAASLLVLLGMTYIFMAGANQFSLSPRWLILIVLALVMSIPFQMTPRHDHTQYRRLVAEGGGYGLFPPIPYGPNEQGFGPRLPPSWYEEPARLGAGDVRSWTRLGAVSPDSGRPMEARVAAVLSARLPGWREDVDSDAGRERVVAALNAVIAGRDLYDGEVYAGLRTDQGLMPYLAEVRAGRELSPAHEERMNRLLLEKSLPGVFNPASSNRWKKPRHIDGGHFLGTDESGRDVLVRVIHGARVSLSVGFVSVFLATVIGLVMGSLAAYYGRWVDMAISRFIEIMMCFPSFFLILAVIAVLDRRSIINIMLVIGLTSWTGMARLVRGEMLRQKKMEYVSASIALGAPDVRTIFRHILPNAMAPVLVSISFGITGAILTEASLSFIGFGVTPPTPTWGQLLSETRDSPLANWWLAVFPGIVLFLSVVAYNLVGEALRDALDPRTSL